MTKVALVTGASSGIGAAVAQRLASMGVKTYVAARRIEKMESLQDLVSCPVNNRARGGYFAPVPGLPRAASRGFDGFPNASAPAARGVR